MIPTKYKIGAILLLIAALALTSFLMIKAHEQIGALKADAKTQRAELIALEIIIEQEQMGANAVAKSLRESAAAEVKRAMALAEQLRQAAMFDAVIADCLSTPVPDSVRLPE